MNLISKIIMGILIGGLISCVLPVTALQSFGADTGWIVVHSNVDGATVLFDNEVKGIITDGILKVQVNITGTPYHVYTVKKDGYSSYGAGIDEYPGRGETVDVYANLSIALTPTQTVPIPTPTTPTQVQTPAPTGIPVSPIIPVISLGYIGILMFTRRKKIS